MFLTLVIAFFLSVQSAPLPHVFVETSLGAFEIELEVVKAPIQVIQASRARGKAGRPPIALERTSVTGLKHFAGTLSMARSTAADSGSSDFFVCIKDTPELDYGGRRNPDGQGFAAFGRVVSGMDVVRKIHASPIDEESQGRARETLTPPVKIRKMYRK